MPDHPRPAHIAFFDVDGTVTTSATMFRFLRYYLAAVGRPPRAYDEHRQRLRAMEAVGCPREEINRAYFTVLAGAPAQVVDDLAEEWFAAELAVGGLYHQPVLDALDRHRAAGDHVVLVSGSYPALLLRISADLGADAVHCTRPEIVRGRYTGRLTGPPMIGEAKGHAVRAAVAQRETDRAYTTAYGDHFSDLPMLSAAGTAVVVGGDTALRAIAAERRWLLLPGALPPPPAPVPVAVRTGPHSPHVPDEVPESA